MSLVEKVNITTGTGWENGPCVGNTGAAVRVGFPALCLQDGPLGVRFADAVTAFPAGITVAATWNRDLMYKRAKALGKEHHDKGVHVLLGPTIGPIGRLPAGGRNWEGFGSDPYLQGIAAGLTVKGIQEEGVIATAKHWLGNEQEMFRQAAEGRSQGFNIVESMSSNIGEKVMREIYAWPFMDAVKENVGCVMCSYNQINNSYACQNSYLLNGVLKDEFGFQGFVVSDWIAQRSGVASVLAGLDMTMPGDAYVFNDGKSFLGPELTRSVLNGSVPLSRLDDMVERVVAAWYMTGQDKEDPIRHPNFSSWFRTPSGRLFREEKTIGLQNEYIDARGDHHEVAREIAEEGIVLLKNSGETLPFGSGKKARKAMVVFGTGATGNPLGTNGCPDHGCNDGTLGQGWGSGSVDYSFFDTPLSALSARARADRTMFNYILTDDANHQGIKLAANAWQNTTCIVFASADSGEGYIHVDDNYGDRHSLHLQHSGDAMISAVAATCKDTIVVIHSVGPVLVERWIDHENVTAVVVAHLPGQEAGESLANVLYGNINPSGKLPYTIARSEDDYGLASRVLYKPSGRWPQQDFLGDEEGGLLDYRYLDAHNIEPRFAFGFGLSYSHFTISNTSIYPLWEENMLPPSEFPPKRNSTTISPSLTANTTIHNLTENVNFPPGFHKVRGYIYPYLPNAPAHPSPQPPPPNSNATANYDISDLFTPLYRVTALVNNTHPTRAGKHVAQLYVLLPTSNPANNTRKVLRGFEKVYLQPGEVKGVDFILSRRDVSEWDVVARNWKLMTSPEDIRVVVSSSARNGGAEAKSFVWKKSNMTSSVL